MSLRVEARTALTVMPPDGGIVLARRMQARSLLRERLRGVCSDACTAAMVSMAAVPGGGTYLGLEKSSLL